MQKKYTIISDSSCDLKSTHLTCAQIDFVTAPIFCIVGGIEHVDHEDTDVVELLAKMKQSKTASKTACPSPETFAEQMRAGNENIICVTLSSKLSGTYSSAMMAAETVRTEQPDKQIFVLDSLTTSAGLARLLHKLVDLIKSEKFSFAEITQQITDFRGRNRIRFFLNDLSNFVKSGRMSKVAGIISSIIPIKLLCGDNGEGEVKKYKQVIGFKKAVEALSEFPGESLKTEGVDNPIFISHCNSEENASLLKKLLECKFGFKNIKTFLMRGTATTLANEKGLTLAY